MKLTRKQEEGLKIAVSKYYNHDPFTVISGYAGTGKSTLVNFVISALNINPSDVAYIAYTGKAALVLKEKNCPNATTAHQLLYKSYRKKDGTFCHIPKRPLDAYYKLIVVDEVSMLPLQMWELLLSHHIHVIALGDPGQLPPVKSEDNHVLDHPDIFLDEVMRQAQESEIIRLTMDIRDKKPLNLYNGNEVKIIDQSDLLNGIFTWADAILAGTNATKNGVNRYMRERLFGVTDDEPIEGDRVMCMKNDWHTFSDEGEVLVNGLTGTIHNIRMEYGVPLLNVHLTADFLPDTADDFKYNYIPWEAYFHDLLMDYNLFTKKESTVNESNFNIFQRQKILLKEFDYAYCITCHKSQGSEYDKVLVLEERLPTCDHSRWLYTAATRAKDKLVIVRNYKRDGE